MGIKRGFYSTVRTFSVACAAAAKLLCLVLLAIVGTCCASAQIAQFTPSSPSFVRSANATVSVRDLRIPSRARSELVQGLRHLSQRDAHGSLTYFAAAIQIFPDYYEAYYHQGIAETRLAHYDAALDSFQRSIDLSEGKYPRAEFGYGLVLCKLGQARDAERVIRHGLQTDSNIADGYVVLALALLHLHRLEEAERSALESLRMGDSKGGMAYLVLADIYSEERDFRAQAGALTSYLSLNPDDPDARLLRASRDAASKIAVRLEHPVSVKPQS